MEPYWKAYAIGEPFYRAVEDYAIKRAIALLKGEEVPRVAMFRVEQAFQRELRSAMHENARGDWFDFSTRNTTKLVWLPNDTGSSDPDPKALISLNPEQLAYSLAQNETVEALAPWRKALDAAERKIMENQQDKDNT